MREVTITANDAGQRLDRFLKKYLCNAPLSLVYKAVRKDVKVNGKRAKEETLLAEGDVLQIYLGEDDLDALTKKKRTHAAKRQFTVAYEDENVLVLCKPFGLLVHGDSTEKKDTLARKKASCRPPCTGWTAIRQALWCSARTRRRCAR